MELISWALFQQRVYQLGEVIIQSGYQPEIIVAVARGGWVPAIYLSEQLTVKKMVSVGVRYIDRERTELDFYSFPSGLEGLRVLLVEDRLETAKSLQYCVNHLRADVSEIKTACLYYRSDSCVMPDYCLDKTDGTITFPWELQ